MTVIIALKENNNIYVGADRQLTAGDIKTYANDSKIIEKKIKTTNSKEKTITFLTTGYAHYTGFIKYVFEPPEMGEENDFEYINKLIKKFRENIEKSAWLIIDNEQADYEGEIIIIFNNNIYKIDAALGIIKCKDYCIAGSGKEIALGVLYATQNNKPETKIKTMIQACEKYLTSVGEGIDIKKIRGS